MPGRILRFAAPVALLLTMQAAFSCRLVPHNWLALPGGMVALRTGAGGP